MLANKLFLNLVVTFSLFSGSYIIGGVKFYPPLLFALLGFCQSSLGRKMPGILVSEIKWWFLFLALMLLCYFVGQNNDYLFVLFRYLSKAILIPFGCCLLIRNLAQDISERRSDFHTLMRQSVAFALYFQFIIVILQLTLPSFREAFNSIIELTDEWKALADVGHFRATGLAGLSIYDTSIAYGILYLFFLPWCTSNNLTKNFKFLLITLIICVLSLIAGRSGFIFVFTIFLFFFIYSRRKIFYSFSLTLFITLTIIAVIAVMGIDKFTQFLQFVFEPIYNYMDTGSFETASTNELIDSYLFIPWEVPPLTGFGFWAQPSLSEPYNFIYKTDSGILLNYIAFGVAGLVFVLSYTWHFIKNHLAFIEMNSLVLKGGFGICMAALVFSFALKGPIYFSEKIMTAYFIWLIYNSQEKKELDF
ncbi:TPA: hypothetical protein QCJ32_003061 [Enterobacter asburiae]|jgi:hypothetical protein|uniref:hypothetical protein n=1 Tax=Enterobacter asburiae TaxID=61645 RepID=UPI0007B36181|nr:hypothetical protein [Enterobacter asburiae]KZR40652.1 hypothetical protein A3N68_22225 [Enterobacter asburiae]MBL5925188.1 hypothetical protein [Enterobacter asburiae]MBL5956181.1 hypothetical protein [Enterobacter asburiae]MBN4801468.1 hypothetical protein [Enterobacter asburiae]MBN4806254.1 hypothetical protein [Enterobacter asburiae]